MADHEVIPQNILLFFAFSKYYCINISYLMNISNFSFKIDVLLYELSFSNGEILQKKASSSI